MRIFELRIGDNLYVAHAEDEKSLLELNEVFRNNKGKFIEVDEEEKQKRRIAAQEASDKIDAEIEKEKKKQEKKQKDIEDLFKKLSSIDLDRLIEDYKKEEPEE